MAFGRARGWQAEAPAPHLVRGREAGRKAGGPLPLPSIKAPGPSPVLRALPAVHVNMRRTLANKLLSALQFEFSVEFGVEFGGHVGKKS